MQNQEVIYSVHRIYYQNDNELDNIHHVCQRDSHAVAAQRLNDQVDGTGGKVRC